MRVVAEFIPASNRILVRLLGTLPDPDLMVPATFVQVGTYLIDGTPQIVEALSFDVTDDDIVDNEAKVYFAGYHPLPSTLKVTLPDATVQTIVLGQVQDPVDRILDPQKTETIEPVEPELHQPAHADFRVDEMQPAEVPSTWFELNFSNPGALKLGKGLLSDILSYQGGGPGRILSSTLTQPETNYAPYKLYGNTYMEGAFTNNLPNSDFATTYVPPGFFDHFPTGWSVAATDPESLLRFMVGAEKTVIPNVTLVYYLRSTYNQSPSAPVARVTSPPVPVNNTFQILVDTPRTNANGSIKMVSATGLFSTPSIPLIQGTSQIITLNVQGDPGPVEIQWFQLDGNLSQQRLGIFAPIASIYNGPHTWLPYSETSAPDIVTIDNMTRETPWIFGNGNIRVESYQEEAGKPFSWSLRFKTSDKVFLKLEEGMLSSDYATGGAVDITTYLLANPDLRGNYKLKWRAGQNFRIVTKEPDLPEVETVIPFSLDPIPPSVLLEPLKAELRSFSATQGSSRVSYFAFLPL